MPILEVKNLCTYLYTRQGVVKAVDGISFKIERGETLGLVGESGSGKSMTCLSIMRLLPWPTGETVGGQILFNGEDLLEKSETEMCAIRGRFLAMIPQDPYTSLNPCFTIGNQVMEPLQIHLHMRGKKLRDRAVELLRLVRIPDAQTRLRNYPHELSGGMRQRVVGSIASSCYPQLVLADEPTTSLDVTIQAQFLYLLKQIQRKVGMAMIYVTHDLGVISKVCDRVLVMYAGKIVESASINDIFARPAHPYTKGLIASVAPIDHDVDRLPSIEGQPPELYNLPDACSFADRCSLVIKRCREAPPPETEPNPGHFTACWRYVNGS